MGQNKFHKDFQLNSNSFASVNELLNFAENFSEDLYCFLNDWFSDDHNLKVKTSGSTGIPKQISLQKMQIINSAFATGNYFSLQDNTTALLCLPLAYIAGKMMLIRALTLGWQLDMVESDSKPLKTISKTYDFSAMVPLQMENSLDKIEQIKKLIVGGGVVSNSLQKKIQSIKTNVFATYGMTETITHIAVKKLNQLNSKPNFYQILPDVEIYIDDRNCLVINAPKVSKKIIFTNDVVRLISDTQFEWLGRFDNVINSGGFKLYPEKIEEKLVVIIKQRFFVAGIPDDKLGEKLVLIVEGEEQKLNFEKAFLSKFEFPKETYFIEEFIETETKKIQRKKTLDLISF